MLSRGQVIPELQNPKTLDRSRVHADVLRPGQYLFVALGLLAPLFCRARPGFPASGIQVPSNWISTYNLTFIE